MKNTKSASEECGVWLDAAELRAKKQQKAVRPVSKLLNPLARAGGYSMAVALNFTQTRMDMPATKQSTISSFFLPKNKINKDNDGCSSTHPATKNNTTLPDTRTKRKREMLIDLPSEPKNMSSHASQTQLQDLSANMETSEKNHNDSKKEQQFFHLLWGHECTENEPEEQRRPFKDTEHKCVTKTKEGCNREPWHSCTTGDKIKAIPEYLLIKDQQNYKNNNEGSLKEKRDNFITLSLLKTSHHQSPLKKQDTETNASFSRPDLITGDKHKVKHFVQSQKVLGFSEKIRQPSPVKKKNKENSRPTTPTIDLSPYKQKLSLGKSPVKFSSDLKEKFCLSLMRSNRPCTENEEDSLAKLFTQDSEGYRVIASHGKLSRQPFKDQTNSTKGQDYWDLPSVPTLESDIENSDMESQMLFTQDSQGNMVIKHKTCSFPDSD